MADEAEGGGRAAASAPSLSLINISNGSQKNASAIAKRAETLYQNLEGLIQRVGIERVGLVTCTFPYRIIDRFEASRRFDSLATGVLRPQKLEFITVPERHDSGGFHFHLATAFPYDIRTGFDFDAATNAAACKREHYFRGGKYHASESGFGWTNAAAHRDFKRWERAYVKSANERLRDWWNYFRPVAERYGFGRCETLPVLSNASAIARYVGAYVTTASGARLECDRGMRLVRYSLARVPVEDNGVVRKISLRRCNLKWSWVGGNGAKWRRGLQLLGTILELDMDGLAALFGSKFQYTNRRAIFALGEGFENALPLVSKIPEWADRPSRMQFLVRLLNTLQKDEIFDQNLLSHAPDCPF